MGGRRPAAIGSICPDPGVIAVGPAEDNARVARLMIEDREANLSVLDGDRIVGLVGMCDLLRRSTRTDDYIASEL